MPDELLSFRKAKDVRFSMRLVYPEKPSAPSEGGDASVGTWIYTPSLGRGCGI
jgi:hypothetical protein